MHEQQRTGTLAVDAWSVFQWSSWFVIVLMTGFTSWYVLQVVLTTSWFSDASVATQFFADQRASNFLLFGHVLTAFPCLILGPWLFLPRFRKCHMNTHRLAGKIYVATVLVSSVMGFMLATHNKFGHWARAGFMTLAVVWFTTTYIGYRKVIKRDLFGHRRWMIRSYAISIAVVSVRFLATPDGWTLKEWYPILTWLCWVPNLLLAEIYLRVSDDKGRFKPPRFMADIKALASRRDWAT